MVSKEKQAVKNLNLENDENRQDANTGEPPALPLGAVNTVPRGNCRWFRVRQPILQYRWDVTPRHGEPQEENMETTGKEVRKLMEYLREKDLSHKLWTVGGTPHHDHHDGFRLVP
ncbi:hypothetical protein K5549_000582 [Capra hircus]|uniref:Uncharacterized protein n=1 Tax=Capra hircus TaxID=9925 RepID=A0A452EZ34_CAPHI|nr:hypothetical protein K5549_000582 [Capra hircus]